MLDVIADDVVDHLRTLEITSCVDWLPELDLPETDQRRVIVGVQEMEGEPSARGFDQEDHTIQIGVVVRLGKNPGSDAVREELNFVRSLRDAFKRIKLETSRGVLARWANRPVYDKERLRKDGLFVSVLQLTFRVFV